MLREVTLFTETTRGGYVPNYGLIDTGRIVWGKRTSARGVEEAVTMLKMDGGDVLICAGKPADFCEPVNENA